MDRRVIRGNPTLARITELNTKNVAKHCDLLNMAATP
jgi:hypothetical protein